MSNATISPSLPGLSQAFAGTPNIETLSGLALSLPSLSIVLTAFLFGWLAERLDRRKLIASLALLYGLAGASGALAPSIEWLLASRIVLGIAVAGIMTLVTMMAGELWRGPPRERFMGLQAAATSAGGVLFLVAGGLLAEIDWRGPFMVYLLAVPLVPFVWLVLAAPLQQTSATRDDSRAAPPADIAWLPVLEVALVAFLIMVAFYIIPTRLPFLITDLPGGAASISGFAIASLTLSGIPASLLFAKLSGRSSPLTIFAGALALMATGYCAIGLAHGLVLVFLGCILSGAGLGLIMPNQMSWLMSRVNDASRGRASGLLTMAIFGGQFASPLFAGLLARWLTIGQSFLFLAISLGVMSVMMAMAGVRAHPRASSARID